MAKVYGGRWELVDSLSKGGQGEIFIVRDKQGTYPENLALKRVLNPKRHDRFRSEVHAIKSVSHPNIIKLIDHSVFNEDGDKPEKQYLVMPLAAAGDLSKRAALYKGNLDSVLQVFRQLADALNAAHQAKIIHRDVKPQNILFSAADHEVWLSDFGICLVRDQDRSTESGEVVGPVQFMAPELEAAAA